MNHTLNGEVVAEHGNEHVSHSRSLGDPKLHQVRDFLEEPDTDGPNPLHLALRLFRGRSLIIAFLALVLAVLFGALAYMAVSPKYQSQGLIRVAARIPKVMYSDPNDPRLRLFDSFVSAEVTYLGSRPVLERAMDKILSTNKEIDRSKMDISDLSKIIGVKKNKGLISVSALAKSPENASLIVNAVLEAYTEMHLETSSQNQSIRERQLTTRETELLDKLTSINARILEVGEEHGTTSIAKAHLNKVTQLEDIDQRLSELKTTIAQEEAQESSTEFDTGDDEIKRVTVLDKAMTDMTYDRAKRAASMESKRLRYSDTHPEVKALETEIAVIDSALEARRQQIVTLGKTGALTASSGQKSQDSLQGLLALRKKLTTRRAEVAREAKDLNSKLIELTFLKEEHSEIRTLLDETRRALEEVIVESRNSLPGSVEVVSFGATPRKPVEDKRKKLVVAGAGFGVFAALGLVIMGGIARPRIRYSDDLAAVAGEDSVIGTLPDGDSMPDLYQQSIHKIRNRLQLRFNATGDAQSQVLTLCGTAEEHDASKVSLSLGQSYGDAEYKTVVVDTDFVEQRLSKQLKIDGSRGFRDAVKHGRIDETTQQSEFKNLSIISNGVDDSMRSENISSNMVDFVLNPIAKINDVVIINTGEIKTNLSAVFMADRSHFLICVVAAGANNRDVKRFQKWAEKDTRCKPLFILNRARPDDPDFC